MKIKRPQSSQPLPKHAKKVFSGVLFDVYQWQQKQYDGTDKTFEKIKRNDTVTIIPITTEGKIILTEQEQPGTEAFIGFPGGVIDGNEDPLACAKRELFEETGYTAKKFVLWDAMQLNSKLDWALYTFVAKGCQKTGEPHLDSGEKIKVKSVIFDEFLHLAAAPNFRDLEISLKVFRAKEGPKEMNKLKKLFSA